MVIGSNDSGEIGYLDSQIDYDNLATVLGGEGTRRVTRVRNKFEFMGWKNPIKTYRQLFEKLAFFGGYSRGESEKPLEDNIAYCLGRIKGLGQVSVDGLMEDLREKGLLDSR